MKSAVFFLLCAAAPALAEPLSFEGRVEANRKAELSSRLDGVVADVLFTGGENVSAGTPMILLDTEDIELSVATAQAQVSRAEAAYALAQRDAQRTLVLENRGIATEVRADTAEAALKDAAAQLDVARITLRRAELDLRRSVIRAPIDGFAGRPNVALGAFVEAESGAALGEIVQIDPALVAYRVPYAVRLESMAQSGSDTIEALFEQIELTIRTTGGWIYPHGARPDFASTSIDPNDGTLTVWATFPNPNAVLRPGMSVTVLSEITPEKDTSQ